MQINIDRPRERNHPEERQPTKTQILIGAAVVSLFALAAIKAVKVYGYYQNGTIENIDCRFGETVEGIVRDFAYYKNVAEKGDVSGQYCFAKMHEIGIGTVQNLEEARNWYKKAHEQGLTSLVYRSLCQPHMFEEKCGNKDNLDRWKIVFRKYSEFKEICCSQKHMGPLSAPPTCPWTKEEL